MVITETSVGISVCFFAKCMVFFDFKKIDGRSYDEFKSFAEFIKLRYKQESSGSEGSLLYYIGLATDEPFLQNKIVDKLIETNALRMQEDEKQDDEYLRVIVDKARNDVLKQAEENGFLQGVKEGQNSGALTGHVRGLQQGIEEGKALGQKEERERLINKNVDIFIRILYNNINNRQLECLLKR